MYSQDSKSRVSMNQEKIGVGYPSAEPKADPLTINTMGFAYLFKDPAISEEGVKVAMLGGDGVVRYSQELALYRNRAMAVVLFRCAQLVFRARMGLDTSTLTIGGQFIIQASRIHTDADLSGEEVQEYMSQLTHLGVFTRYIADRSGEVIFNDWYTFSDESEYFPELGKVKM